MPAYEYIDCNGHKATVVEPMVSETIHICKLCGEEMWRKPQKTAVNWNGLKPSAGEMSDTFKELIEDAPRRRDEYEETHGGD